MRYILLPEFIDHVVYLYTYPGEEIFALLLSHDICLSIIIDKHNNFLIVNVNNKKQCQKMLYLFS